MSDEQPGGNDEPPLLEDEDFESATPAPPAGNLWLKIAFGVVVSIALVTGVMYVKGLGPFAFAHEKTPFDDEAADAAADALPAPSALPVKAEPLPDPKPVEPSAVPTPSLQPEAEPVKAAPEPTKPAAKKAAAKKTPTPKAPAKKPAKAEKKAKKKKR